jgi:hypothetical protein
MSERRPALIVYDGLPVSSGGAHGLGRRGPADVWAQLSRFLHECADLIGSYLVPAFWVLNRRTENQEALERQPREHGNTGTNWNHLSQAQA